MGSNFPLQKGVNPSTNHGFQNPGCPDGRYPFHPVHSRIQGYSHEPVSKNLGRPYVDNHRSLSYGHELPPQASRASLPQSFSHKPTTPQNYPSIPNHFNSPLQRNNLEIVNSQTH